MLSLNIFKFGFPTRGPRARGRELGAISSLLHVPRSMLFVICSMLFAVFSLPLSADILDVQVLWDVADEPLNIGDLIHFKVTSDEPGSALVDISTVHQTSIQAS